MKTTRAVAGTVGAAFAALALCLVTAAPAAAASDSGAWQAYGNNNPIKTTAPWAWFCGSSYPFDTYMLAQACVVRPVSGTGAKAAVIVRNNRSSLYGVQVAMTLNNVSDKQGLGRWVCGNSGVAAHSWSVCYGQPINAGNPVYVKDAGVNGQPLPPSPAAP